jgi:predicted NBD/HSP70 family sugar kinase
VTSLPPAAGRVVLGIDFGGSKIAIAVCGLDGERLGSATVATGAERGARAVLGRAVGTAHDLLAEAAPGAQLAAVGVSTIGIPRGDGVDLAPNIPGWDGIGLGRELGSAFGGAEIKLATDVKAAAQAEARWGTLAGCEPAVYLNLGTGLASAVVTGGRVLAGSHGAAGEIGYNLREVTDAGAGAGERTLLEDVVSGQGLARRAAESLGRRFDAAQIFAQYTSEPGLARLVGEFVAELAFHVVNLAILIDPQRIAVGGGMVRSWGRIGPGLKLALDAGVPFPPELVMARFLFDAPLMGAIALGVEAAQGRLDTEAVRTNLQAIPGRPPSPTAGFSTGGQG